MNMWYICIHLHAQIFLNKLKFIEACILSSIAKESLRIRRWLIARSLGMFTQQYAEEISQ